MRNRDDGLDKPVWEVAKFPPKAIEVLNCLLRNLATSEDIKLTPCQNGKHGVSCCQQRIRGKNEPYRMRVTHGINRQLSQDQSLREHLPPATHTHTHTHTHTNIVVLG